MAHAASGRAGAAVGRHGGQGSHSRAVTAQEVSCLTSEGYQRVRWLGRHAKPRRTAAQQCPPGPLRSRCFPALAGAQPGLNGGRPRSLRVTLGPIGAPGWAGARADGPLAPQRPRKSTAGRGGDGGPCRRPAALCRLPGRRDSQIGAFQGFRAGRRALARPFEAGAAAGWAARAAPASLPAPLVTSWQAHGSSSSPVKAVQGPLLCRLLRLAIVGCPDPRLHTVSLLAALCTHPPGEPPRLFRPAPGPQGRRRRRDEPNGSLRPLAAPAPLAGPPPLA